jgi:hypothetical protein
VEVLAKAGNNLVFCFPWYLLPAFANTMLCAELVNSSHYHLIRMFHLVVEFALRQCLLYYTPSTATTPYPRLYLASNSASLFPRLRFSALRQRCGDDCAATIVLRRLRPNDCAATITLGRFCCDTVRLSQTRRCSV